MELTLTMEAAVMYAAENGGTLVRYPGGFWAREGWIPNESPWFGTKTVQGLVTRGVAEYTEHRDGRNGSFPVKVKVSSNRDS